MTRTTHPATNYAARIAHYTTLITHHDLTLIVVAMLVTRLLAVVVLRVGGYVAETGPDSTYHFQLGRLAASGAYPFVDYWVEYPPFFPWLSVVAYKISALLPSWIDQRFWFNLTLHGLIAPFDVGNVVLIYLLARRIHHPELAIKSAWLYAILFVPLFVVLGWFESIALFFVLLALWAILADHPLTAGVAMGLGILVKPYVALVGAVALIHTRPFKRLFGLVAAGACTLLLGIAPFLISSPQMLKAHLDTLLTLPGWSSPYALIDGVIKHVDPQVADRFDVTLAASPLVPSRIPWGLVTLVFGAVYLVILIRSARQRTPRAALGLAGLTLIFYLLWSKGYSPQWSLYLIALLCILLPNLLGAVVIAVLEMLYVIEWPITFILLNADTSYLTALVVVRTAVMLGLALWFGAVIFTRQDSPRWLQVNRWAKIGSAAALLAVMALAMGALPLYAAQRYQADSMRPAVDLIKTNATPDHAGVLFDRVDTYERLAPFLPGYARLSAMQLGGAADAWSAGRIQAFSAERPELWYVIDYGADAKKDQRQAIDQRLSQSLCKVSREFAGSAQVSRFVNTQPDRELNATADFENGIRLERARINSGEFQAGDPICLELQWSATSKPSADYTVFVHVLDQNGQLIAQSDLPAGGGYAPAHNWPIGQSISDRHGVVLPPNLSPGTYRVVTGLYGPDGTRLKPNAAGSPEPDSLFLTEFTLRQK